MANREMTPEQREARQVELLEQRLARSFPKVPRRRRPDMAAVRARWSASARAAVDQAPERKGREAARRPR